MYQTIFQSLHDPYMVSNSIFLPIKENHIAGAWGIAAVLPAAIINEPIYAIRTVGEFGIGSSRKARKRHL